MEKCLVTKLKSIVDNDNLPIMGGFKIIVSETSKETLYRYISSDMIKFVKSNGGDFEASLDNGAYFQADYDNNGRKFTTIKFSDIKDSTLDYAIKFTKSGVTTLTIKNKYWFPCFEGKAIPPYTNSDVLKYSRPKYIHMENMYIDELLYPDVVETVIVTNIKESLISKMTNLVTLHGYNTENPSTIPDSVCHFSGRVKKWDLNTRTNGNLLDIRNGVSFMDNDSINNMLIDLSNLTGNKETSKKILIWSSVDYSPSDAAKTAIAKLKSELGYVSIKFGDTELS